MSQRPDQLDFEAVARQLKGGNADLNKARIDIGKAEGQVQAELSPDRLGKLDPEARRRTEQALNEFDTKLKVARTQLDSLERGLQTARATLQEKQLEQKQKEIPTSH